MYDIFLKRANQSIIYKNASKSAYDNMYAKVKVINNFLEWENLGSSKVKDIKFRLVFVTTKHIIAVAKK